MFSEEQNNLKGSGELGDDLHAASQEFKTGDKGQALFMFTHALEKSFSREARKAKDRKKQAEKTQDHHHPSLKNVEASASGSDANISLSEETTDAEDDAEFNVASGDEDNLPDASGDASREAVAEFGSSIIRGRGKGPMVFRTIMNSGTPLNEEEKRKALKKRRREAEKIAVEVTTQQALKRQRLANEQAVATSSSTKPTPATTEALTVMDEAEYGIRIRNKSQILLPNPDNPDVVQDIHVFNVNDADPELQPGMLVREYEREHVDAIKSRMIRNPAAMVLPWAVVILGLKSPKDFDMQKLYNHEYTFIPIGGLHSCIASQELVAGKTDQTDPVHLNCWQHRNAFMFADNLSEEELMYLGNKHNTDAAYRKDLSFMEKVKMFRSQLKNYNIIDAEGKLDKESLKQWKQACLRMSEDGGAVNGVFANDVVNRNSTQFMVARWADECFNKLEMIESMHAKYQLKGQKKPKRKAKNSDKQVPKPLGATDVTKLSGLADAKLNNLLLQVINKSITLQMAARNAITEKITNRIVDAAKTIAGLNSQLDTWNYFSKQTIRYWVMVHGKQFSKDKTEKSWPKLFHQHVTKKIKERMAAVKAATERQQAEEAAAADAAAVAEEAAAEADGGSGSSTKKGRRGRKKKAAPIAATIDPFLNTMQNLNYEHRVFLKAREELEEGKEGAYKNFRGFTKDEVPDDAKESLTAGGTHINLIRGDAKSLTELQDEALVARLLPDDAQTMKFSLAIIDPPYGLTQETWDTHAWDREEFMQVILSLMQINTGDGFNFVSFCSAGKISIIINLLKEWDTASDQCQWTINVQHAVWYKRKYYDQRELLYSQNILSHFLSTLQHVLNSADYNTKLTTLHLDQKFDSKYFEYYLLTFPLFFFFLLQLVEGTLSTTARSSL